MTNFYEILEIKSNASNEDITKAYRRMAKIYHPDVSGNDSESSKAMFRLINLAKETLLDSAKRLEHDYNFGIKQRPNQNNQYQHQSNANQSKGMPIDEVIGWGLLAFIVGAALGGADKK